MFENSLKENLDDKLKEHTLSIGKQLGFNSFYDDWAVYETKNFIFHSHVPAEHKKDFDTFMIRREEAYDNIQSFFNVQFLKKIDMFVWTSREEAYNFMNRHLGFAMREFGVIHSAGNQTPGHEITHIFAGYINKGRYDPFIEEGVATLFDQTNKNRLEFAKQHFNKNKLTSINIYWFTLQILTNYLSSLK